MHKTQFFFYDDSNTIDKLVFFSYNICMLNQFGTSVRNYGLISSGSQEVDTILGGGIRKGTLMEIYGDENARKEIIALGVSKYADKPLLYFNTDGTLDNKNANKYFFFIKKTYQKQKIYAISEILSAKKIISIIKEFDRGILSTIILDSLTTLGLHTAIRLVPLLSIEAKRLDLPIILISHCNILQRPIGYFTTIKYTSQRLEVRYSGPRKKNGKKVGINVLLKCTKSHIIPERRTCKLTLSFLCLVPGTVGIARHPWQTESTDWLNQPKQEHQLATLPANI